MGCEAVILWQETRKLAVGLSVLHSAFSSG